MSQSDSITAESPIEFSTIVFARRCKLHPELLSKWEDMRIFLKLRENRDRISKLSDLVECIDPECIDDDEISKIGYQLRELSQAILET